MPSNFLSPFARYVKPGTNKTLASAAISDQPSVADAMKKLGEYVEWPVRYFTGSDVGFYLFQDNQYHKLEEVAACMYNIEEQVMPLRSYSDYTSRKIVNGVYIVIGTIAIFYTQYQWLAGQIDEFNTHLGQISSDGAASVAEDETIPSDGLVDAGGGFLQNLNGQGEFEAAVAGDVWSAPEQAVSSLTASDINAPRFKMPPFNLLITIGSTNNNVIGEGSIAKSRLLIGIYITGKSISYANDGQPLVEVYQFIATDETVLRTPDSKTSSRALGEAINQTPDTRIV